MGWLYAMAFWARIGGVSVADGSSPKPFLWRFRIKLQEIGVADVTTNQRQIAVTTDRRRLLLRDVIVDKVNVDSVPTKGVFEDAAS